MDSCFHGANTQKTITLAGSFIWFLYWLICQFPIIWSSWITCVCRRHAPLIFLLGSGFLSREDLHLHSLRRRHHHNLSYLYRLFPLSLSRRISVFLLLHILHRRRTLAQHHPCFRSSGATPNSPIPHWLQKLQHSRPNKYKQC